ncbi:MAG: DUF6438 domain-containing protein, partial [Fulvivirga sp.]
MRKASIIFIVFLLSSSQKIFGQIDNIVSDNDLENFIIQEFNYSSFYLFKKDSADNSQYWFKGDFNHDGINDIFVYGIGESKARKQNLTYPELFFIIGGKKLNIVDIPIWYFKNIFNYSLINLKMIEYENRNYISLDYRKFHGKELIEANTDTIFIQYDELMKFSKNPSYNEISSIDFKTTTCYGSCPVFELHINSKRNAIYNGIKYVNKIGEQRMIADQTDWNYIESILKNMRVQELDSSYWVNWTDSQTGYLIVNFEDGSKKRI